MAFMDLQLAFIWGAKCTKVIKSLDYLEEVHFGLGVTNLIYSDLKEGRLEKKKFYSSVKSAVEKINKDVRDFNAIIRLGFGKRAKLKKLEQVDLRVVRKIVNAHKGDHPRERASGSDSIEKYILARDNSASSLARQKTSILLSGSLKPLRVSISNFWQSMEEHYAPFDAYKKSQESFSKNSREDLDRARAVLSIGLEEEAVFIVGRCLEEVVTRYLVELKRSGNRNLVDKKIKDMDFDTKINVLHGRLKLLSPNQYSKIMAIKWDRNVFGHRTALHAQSVKDARSVIEIGINSILLLEKKIVKLKKPA